MRLLCLQLCLTVGCCRWRRVWHLHSGMGGLLAAPAPACQRGHDHCPSQAVCPFCPSCICSVQLDLQLGLTNRVLQVETNLASASREGRAVGSSSPSLLIQQALEAIARISKGFNAHLCTRTKPEIGKPANLERCGFASSVHRPPLTSRSEQVCLASSDLLHMHLACT